MRVMVAKITFPAHRGREEKVIRKPSEVRIKSSWKLLTDTATITLARNVKFFDKQKVKEVFKTGDPVVIELGYDGEYHREFTGFVTSVSVDIPIVIQCEDAMWKLKQQPVHISLEQVNLDAFLKQIVTGYDVDAENYNIGPQRYVNTTVAQVLDDLKRGPFNFFSFIRNEKLLCGKVYADEEADKTIDIHLEKQVASNNLVFKSAEEIQVEVKAVSTLWNGDKIEATFGDKGGEIKQLTHLGITDTAELKRLAEEDYKKYKNDRYSGNLVTFGIPIVNHGNKVNLSSDLYPERGGLYFVESVDIGFYQNAQYRRAITLGDLVTNG